LVYVTDEGHHPSTYSHRVLKPQNWRGLMAQKFCIV
jgi:hypothetical protein